MWNWAGLTRRKEGLGSEPGEMLTPRHECSADMRKELGLSVSIKKGVTEKQK
jgi:hypothetical protein